MATAMTGNNSLNTLVGLGNLIQLATGKSQTTTSSSTTQGNISDEGMQRMLQQLLSAKGGVKDIAGAARGTGLYNSTTETQLLNDLDARVSGELAARQAGTTTESSQTTTAPGIGVDKLIGAIAVPMAANLVKPILGKFLGLDEPTTAGAGAAATTGSLGTLSGNGVSAGAAPITSVADNVSVGSAGSAGGNVLSSLGDLIPTAGVSLGGAGDIVSGIASNTGSLAGDLGLSQIDTASNVIGSSVGNSAGALGNFTGLGSVLSGFLGGADGDPFGSPEAFGGTLAAGTVAGGPIGGLVAAVGTTLGMAIRDASVICTALQAKGLLDKDEYAKGQAYIQGIHRFTKRGYYLWGRKVAAKIDNGSYWAIALSLPVAASRTKLIADETKGIKKYFKYPLGSITLFVGQPICFVLGATLAGLDKLRDKEFLNCFGLF